MKKWRESPFFPTWCHMLSDYRRSDASSVRDLPNVKPLFLSKLLSRKYTTHMSTDVFQSISSFDQIFLNQLISFRCETISVLKAMLFFFPQCAAIFTLCSPGLWSWGWLRLAGIIKKISREPHRGFPLSSRTLSRSKMREKIWFSFNFSLFQTFKLQLLAKIQITRCS